MCRRLFKGPETSNFWLVFEKLPQWLLSETDSNQSRNISLQSNFNLNRNDHYSDQSQIKSIFDTHIENFKPNTNWFDTYIVTNLPRISPNKMIIKNIWSAMVGTLAQIGIEFSNSTLCQIEMIRSKVGAGTTTKTWCWHHSNQKKLSFKTYVITFVPQTLILSNQKFGLLIEYKVWDLRSFIIIN